MNFVNLILLAATAIALPTQGEKNSTYVIGSVFDWADSPASKEIGGARIHPKAKCVNVYQQNDSGVSKVLLLCHDEYLSGDEGNDAKQNKLDDAKSRWKESWLNNQGMDKDVSGDQKKAPSPFIQVLVHQYKPVFNLPETSENKKGESSSTEKND